MEYVNKIQELIIAHPRLFKNISTRSQSDLSQGWYKLVDELCQQINIVITDDELANFEVLQIKEKFGSLRFYFKASEKMRPRIKELVDLAYHKSVFSCDRCGEFRPPYSFPTFKLLCESCNENE